MNSVISILADLASRPILEEFQARFDEVNIKTDLYYANFFSSFEDISQDIKLIEQSDASFIFVFSQHVNSLAPWISAKSRLPVFAIEANPSSHSALTNFQEAPYVFVGEGIEGLEHAFRFVWKLLCLQNEELCRQWRLDSKRRHIVSSEVD